MKVEEIYAALEYYVELKNYEAVQSKSRLAILRRALQTDRNLAVATALALGYSDVH